MRYAHFLLLALALLAVSTCGGTSETCTGPLCPGDVPLDSLLNTVVPGTVRIDARVPGFGCVTSTSPRFAWEATGRDLVMLGVFIENIAIGRGGITNPTANVWAWHTGLGLGREGSVSWGDGIAVQDGEFRSDLPIVPLPSNVSFIWAVWAWDDSGLAITHSSPEMFFTTDTLAAAITCP